MKRLIFALVMMVSPAGFAQTESSTESTIDIATLNAAYDASEKRHPSWFRVSLVAGPAMRDFNMGGAQGFESGGEKAYRGGSASLLLGVGRGLLTLESGVMALGTAAEVHTPIEGERPHLIDAQYVGVPVFLKINYIEHPLSSFSLKLGGIPSAQLVNGAAADGVVVTDASGNNQTRVFLPQSDSLLIGGVTGTTPLSRNTAFLIDLSLYKGTVDLDSKGTKNQGVIASIGLVYSL